MPLVLGFELTHRHPFHRREARRWMTTLRRHTLVQVAEKWHSDVFPKHFFSGGPSEYGYEDRSDFYKNEIKPKMGVAGGKNPNIALNLSGRSYRQMVFLVPKISITNHKATVRLKAPRYFKNPFIGTFTKTRTVRRGNKTKTITETKRITRQPDKAEEVTAMSRADERALRRFGAEGLSRTVRSANRTLAQLHKTIQ